MTDALASDLIAYAAAPAPDVWLFLAHPGGNARGKKVIDAITKAKWPVIPADPLKNDRDKLALIASDVRAARRQMDTEAQQALVDALGNDPRAMAGALSQLLSDVSGRITLEDVRRYQAGRVEATGYDVADAAVAGNSAKALTLARHAFATGIAPQVLVAGRSTGPGASCADGPTPPWPAHSAPSPPPTPKRRAPRGTRSAPSKKPLSPSAGCTGAESCSGLVDEATETRRT